MSRAGFSLEFVLIVLRLLVMVRSLISELERSVASGAMQTGGHYKAAMRVMMAAITGTEHSPRTYSSYRTYSHAMRHSG